MQPVPILGVFIAFIGGIVSAHLSSGSFLDYMNHIIIGYLCCALLVVLILLEIKNYSRTQFRQVLLFSLVFIAGVYLYNRHTYVHHEHYFVKHYLQEKGMFVEINAPVKVKKWMSCSAKVIAVRDSIDVNIMNVCGNIKLVLEPKDTSEKLNYGDIIFIKGRIDEIQPNLNPNSFNPQKYYFLKNEFHQMIVQSENWKCVKKSQGENIISLSNRLNQQIVEVLSRYVEGRNEKALVNALVVGNRVNMEDEMVNAYAQTGATHVLAVSGSHLMVLLFFIEFAWKRRPKFLLGSIIKLIFQLFVIWTFVLITGIPASILRAGVMATFLVFGKALRKESSSLNTLLVAIICILVYDSKYVFDLGFQLSVSAVVGLTLFSKPFKRILDMYLVKANWINQSIAISLAAQVATLPISIYYFHIFPVLFIVTGLLIVPISNILLVGGILLFAVHYLNTSLAAGLGKIIEVMAYVSNYIVGSLSKWEFAAIHDIEISNLGLLFAYLGLFGLIGYLVLLKRNAFWFILLFVTLLIGDTYIRQILQAKRTELTIFYDKSKFNLLLKRGFSSKVVSDEDWQEGEVPKYLIKNASFDNPNANRIRINQNSILNIFGDSPVQIVKLSRESNSVSSILHLLHEDFLMIIDQNILPSEIDLMGKYPKEIILSARNKYKTDIVWREWCFTNHIPYFSILEKAAYQKNI